VLLRRRETHRVNQTLRKASEKPTSKPLFAAHRTNVSYADKTDLRFFTFADAALYRNCGDHFAATPPKSRKRSLPSGFEDLFQTELSLLVA
jgi:hypothetical protein